MSPSDKSKADSNSSRKEAPNQGTSNFQTMDTTTKLRSESVSDVNTYASKESIPSVTASLPTSKCSTKNEMKPFDPGEDGDNERLNSKHCGSSTFSVKYNSSSNKNSNKNYKAGSKINKLADMLAKRSQNIVEVTQNNTFNLIKNESCLYNIDTVTVNKLSDLVSIDKSSNNSTTCVKEIVNNDVEVLRKSRRKSVPNQSCTVNSLQVQSTSKSCLDLSKILCAEENDKTDLNALSGSLNKLQTDESTKKKSSKKNLRNFDSTLALPEKKTRSSARQETLSSNKSEEMKIESRKSLGETVKNSGNLKQKYNALSKSITNNLNVAKIKGKVKRKSKRLVETSTQTTEIEFISVIRPQAEVEKEKSVLMESPKVPVVYECIFCTEKFPVEEICTIHEKSHSLRNNKLFKCQYCIKKLGTFEDLKSHCIKKHPKKYPYCVKCDKRFLIREELFHHNREVHFTRRKDSKRLILQEEKLSDLSEKRRDEQSDRKMSKLNPMKSDLKIDVSYDSSKRSSVSPKNLQKCSPKDTKTEEQLLELEILFYSRLSGNIQENLTNHLDGKVDQAGSPNQADIPLSKENPEDPQIKVKANNLLSIVSPASASEPEGTLPRAPSPYKTRSKIPNTFRTSVKKFKKMPNWQQKFREKYNFPSNYRYEHKSWDKNCLSAEKSAIYLKDLSCLDIKTQLIMRENISKLESVKLREDDSKESDDANAVFPNYLSLTPRVKNDTNKEIKIDLVSSDVNNALEKSALKEVQKAFKAPGPETPMIKTRRQIIMDSSSQKKSSPERLKIMTRRQSTIDTMRDDKDEVSKKKKCGDEISRNPTMFLKRQTSLDSFQKMIEPQSDKNNCILDSNLRCIAESTHPSPSDVAEISGEWVRPRSYLCGTCCAKFTNLWELEDHKWVSHPNVWCTHYEFEDEKIEKLFQVDEDESKKANTNESSTISNVKLTDLYKRYLLPYGSLKTAKLVPSTTFPEQCTKCRKSCLNSSEMHKHILDCGGDTTWFLTMYSSPMTIKRKWRPFGSRRRKQIAKRDLKRSISSTPNLKSYQYHHKIRTKPGDMETIQKMLANLPEKRARRAINFDDIKKRSQSTIHNNRLLRKRFKSSFTNNFLKMKNLKQNRQLRPAKKGRGSKSTSDASSESTPTGTPKRTLKPKENVKTEKVNTSAEGSSGNSSDSTDTPKKRGRSKRNETSLGLPDTDKEVVKTVVKKIVTREKNSKSKKLSGHNKSLSDKSKKKTEVIKEETVVQESSELVKNTQSNLIQGKDTLKVGKKLKRISSDRSNVSKSQTRVTNVPELVVTVEKMKESIPKDTPTRNLGKKKCIVKNNKWLNSQNDQISRLKQKSKEKIKLLKGIKKKIQKSKKILEIKEKVKKLKSGSRRSLRIKSLRTLDEKNESNGNTNTKDVITENVFNLQRDSKVIKPIVNLENCLPNKNLKNFGLRNQKNSEIKKAIQGSCNNVKDININKRSSRISSLRSSLSADKSDVNLVFPNPEPNTLDKAIVTSSNYNPIINLEAVVPNTDEVLLGEKLSRVLPSADVPADISNFPNGLGISTTSIPVEVAESNKKCDLEEMPILAKVEPIRGQKICEKQEIPILMPVVEEPGGQQECKKDNGSENSVSFQVIKKRRHNAKEVTPLKIVKTEKYSKDKKIEVNGSFRVEKSVEESSVVSLQVGKSKKKVVSLFDGNAKPIKEKHNKRSKLKKYFLGICPSEIDKGRQKENEESGSDSEPLISLINQFQKKDSNSNNSAAEEDNIIKTEEQEENQNIAIKDENFSNKTTVSVPSKSIPSEPQNSKQIPVFLIKESDSEKSENIKKVDIVFEPEDWKKKQIPKKKNTKKLNVTLTLKDPISNLGNCSSTSIENKWMLKKTDTEAETLQSTEKLVTEQNNDTTLPERRSRRVSKEIKSSNEFIIDDPLILVDELWSDLDSDSDSSKKKAKKGKKKLNKKKIFEEKKSCDINLEELLRNFGENKENSKILDPSQSLPIKVFKRSHDPVLQNLKIRKALENRQMPKSYKRLSLKLFRFNKVFKNFGNRGTRLSKTKEALNQNPDYKESKREPSPYLSFLAAEIKENPVQVIQCRSHKSKTIKKGAKRQEDKLKEPKLQLKISLPLESIHNITGLNNNHLTDLFIEGIPEGPECRSQKNVSGNYESKKETDEVILEKDKQNPNEDIEAIDTKNKTKRSEVIDKIFYCEICKTYYYSSSQLKIHKQSNRHKLKEAELSSQQNSKSKEMVEENYEVGEENIIAADNPAPDVEIVSKEHSAINAVEAEKSNDDTLEMPTLEGPFIENRSEVGQIEQLQPPPPQSFGFTQESLKDIQQAIGCTDEEMLILTLLGENTIEIENDILDLDSVNHSSVQAKSSGNTNDRTEADPEKTNGIFKVDLKQRMTSALACLVNKAVFNLLQKYETVAKTSVNSEAIALLGKLASLSRRKNILQLNELLKKQKDGEPSVDDMPKEIEKKKPVVSYKYQCTICGSRFEKASTRECHISRSHKGKAKKIVDDVQVSQGPIEDDWGDYWNYDNEEPLGNSNSSQFWCSDCGINFLSPQEVLEHQKAEHQTGTKEEERIKDAGPLQSSTIGSSDEIIEGKKPKSRPKLLSSEELDQQRIIANNELRKLDRKFSSKNKTNKVKWGMDALRFTVEKENKMVVMEDEKEIIQHDSEKSQPDLKNIDLVPKLNLSRTSNIPEFKVIQKNSLESRFQKIIDNKLKRKTSRPSQQEIEIEDAETEVMLVPVVVKKKKSKKPRTVKAKKDEREKPLDVYDFNESESESEPIVFSHIKKPMPLTPKLKLVKVKESPSKNKADSTTKDLAPDDYDSEDSLPLSIVKKSKPGEEDEEKDEKLSEDGGEKSEGILEQVEYLIEQLENETVSEKKLYTDEIKIEDVHSEKSEKNVTKAETEKENLMLTGQLRVSLASNLLQLQNVSTKDPNIGEINTKDMIVDADINKVRPLKNNLEEGEGNQSPFDEEDSMPLVFISKKSDGVRTAEGENKCNENTSDFSNSASEDLPFRFDGQNESRQQFSNESHCVVEENSLSLFPLIENKTTKPFDTVNGNVIYCRNESDDFDSDFSRGEVIDSNVDDTNTNDADREYYKEVAEKEDVVIVCSKGNEETFEEKVKRKKFKISQRKNKENFEVAQKKKKRFPLLTATIEENNFRKSESPKLNKEIIVRKIWSRRRLTEDNVDIDEDSFASYGCTGSVENMLNEESQTEVEKEIIVKKIWNRKKMDLDNDLIGKEEEKLEDVKLNQTEVSDEIVIKCGPKTKVSPKRRKSKNSSSESSKESIMRKIWSGKCSFQTKAALKTYDSDTASNNCKENNDGEMLVKGKKRGRPAGLSSTKKRKSSNKSDEDDLDSLLEEIEREQLEKAIRLEFLQLRRSDKANVEIRKEGSGNPTVGLFTETVVRHRKDVSEKRKKKIGKTIRHPKQSLLKRKNLLKKPVRRVVYHDEKPVFENISRGKTENIVNESLLMTNNCSVDSESKARNRKHKKHRHKHHHHKHKHKKSKHHKSVLSKHKSKHKFDFNKKEQEKSTPFAVLEKICQEISDQEVQCKSKIFRKRSNSGSDNFLTVLSIEDSNKETTASEEGLDDSDKGSVRSKSANTYDFADEISNFSMDETKSLSISTKYD